MNILCKLLFLVIFINSLGMMQMANAEDLNDANTLYIGGPTWNALLQADGKGLYWDVLHAIYDPLNIKLIHKVMPWRRAQDSLMNHHGIDMLLGEYHIPANEDKYVFANWPLDYDEVTVVYLKSKNYPWLDEKTFDNQTIAWVKGYNLSARLSVQYTLREVIDLNSGIQSLVAGRFDFLLDYDASLKSAINKSGENPALFEMHNLKRVEKLYAVFGKTEKGRRMAKLFDNGMTNLAKDNKLDNLYQAQGYKDYETTVNFK